MEILIYNWERRPIMRWSNFIWCNEKNNNSIIFDIKVSKSIFEASISIKTCSVDLMKFKNSISALYNQSALKVIYTSCDEKLRVELIREKSGHICQKLHILDSETRSSLTVNDYFDLTFLPELENSINSILT